MRPGFIRLLIAFFFLLPIWGCSSEDTPKPYGEEKALEIPGHRTEVWAVAPAINLSGHREVDAILQADLVFNELQSVKGMTAIPVNRVAQVYAGIEIRQVETERQAARVCDLLGADALLVPTVTAYDPYSPPKMAASLLLFRRVRNTAKQASAEGKASADESDPDHLRNPQQLIELRQAVGMFDSADGTVRDAMLKFSAGRSDPNGPMAEREFFLSMDSYTGFVYHCLIADLLGVPRQQADPVVGSSSTGAAAKSGR